jgi:hypothetical protein
MVNRVKLHTHSNIHVFATAINGQLSEPSYTEYTCLEHRTHYFWNIFLGVRQALFCEEFQTSFLNKLDTDDSMTLFVHPEIQIWQSYNKNVLHP